MVSGPDAEFRLHCNALGLCILIIVFEIFGGFEKSEQTYTFCSQVNRKISDYLLHNIAKMVSCMLITMSGQLSTLYKVP